MIKIYDLSYKDLIKYLHFQIPGDLIFSIIFSPKIELGQYSVYNLVKNLRDPPASMT